MPTNQLDRLKNSLLERKWIAVAVLSVVVVSASISVISGALGLVEKGETFSLLLADKNPEFRPLYFHAESTVLIAESERRLEEYAGVLKEWDGEKIFVDGHNKETDPGANFELAGKRAQAVANKLVLLGIPGRKLEPRSFGAEKPLQTTTNDSPYQARVEISFE